ncbi:MAG TPA: HlyD family secretion protein [Terriglobales bacterium]|nr:HlyD family secretion protein [Terriglobales bacterium]
MATSEDRPTEVITTEERQHPADGDRTTVAQNGSPAERVAPEVGNQQNQEREQEEREAAERTAQRRKSRLKKIVPVVVIVIAVGVLLWWLHARQYEDTDDAQVDGHISQISSRVSGYVTKVYVEDNQEVQAGQLLVEIDPRDYEVALAKAQADYADSQASAAAANYNVPITSVSTASQLASAQAEVKNSEAAVAAAHKNLDAAKAKEVAANADNVKAQADLQRYKPLVQRDVISKQMYDAAVATAQGAQANVQSAQDGVVAAQAGITQAESHLAQSQANLRAAGTGQRQVRVTQAKANSAQSSAAKNKAELEQAQLNIQYTKIYAPIHGIVGHRTVEVGQYVQPGQALMSLVDVENIWITANFKETQLQNMKAGEPAEVTVDAFSRTYNGKVLDIGGASGARFSLFPPENATGNYVKVVQRIPVRIVLNQDKNHALRPGMSVEAKVKVR